MQSKAAKRKGREVHDTYGFWFRRKYNLSPRDPRFLDLTPEEVEAEFWAHHYAENAGKASEEFEDEDFDIDAMLAEINASASPQGGDDDEWEEVINVRA